MPFTQVLHFLFCSYTVASLRHLDGNRTASIDLRITFEKWHLPTRTNTRKRIRDLHSGALDPRCHQMRKPQTTKMALHLKTVDEGLGRSCLEPPSLRYPHGVCMIHVRYTDCCAKFLTVASIPILIRSIPCALLHPSAVPGASGRVYCRSPRQCEFAMPTMHD